MRMPGTIRWRMGIRAGCAPRPSASREPGSRPARSENLVCLAAWRIFRQVEAAPGAHIGINGGLTFDGIAPDGKCAGLDDNGGVYTWTDCPTSFDDGQGPVQSDEPCVDCNQPPPTPRRVGATEGHIIVVEGSARCAGDAKYAATRPGGSPRLQGRLGQQRDTIQRVPLLDRSVGLMEAKELKSLLGTIARAHGFSAAHGGWYRTTPVALIVIEPQKSNFGNYFELNFKWFLGRGLPGDTRELKKLIKSAGGDVFRRQPEEYRTAYDLGLDLSDADRQHLIERMFSDFVSRIVSGSADLSGMLQLRDQGLIYLLPIVEARLKDGLGSVDSTESES
jgi:hypothetical protein